MKIALVTQNINRGDGQGRVCLELAKHALRKGCQVSLFTNFAEPELMAGGARWIPVQPNRWRASLLTVRQFVYLANRALQRHAADTDVIHGFGYSLSQRHQVNSVQFVHRTWSKSFAHPIRRSRRPNALYHWLYTRLNIHWEQAAFKQAEVVVACSPMVKGELIATGIPSGKLRSVCNGVDLDEFATALPCRRALGLPDKVSLFLFAGDIRTPRKNLDLVLRAIKELSEVHLVVVGALPRSPYPAMAETMGIASRVHFLGFRSDLPAIMASVDAFVFPAHYEPFGMVVLEAMASKLPVITAASVGASALVCSNAGIVLQNADSLPPLVAAMERLISNPDERMRMGRAGRAIAEEHSWERMVGNYIKIYHELLQLKKSVLA